MVSYHLNTEETWHSQRLAAAMYGTTILSSELTTEVSGNRGRTTIAHGRSMTRGNARAPGDMAPGSVQTGRAT